MVEAYRWVCQRAPVAESPGDSGTASAGLRQRRSRQGVGVREGLAVGERSPSVYYLYMRD